ncbi:MAG: hypothetical protein QXL15_01530 [Candidatus Korarchaeota archaeon]
MSAVVLKSKMLRVLRRFKMIFLLVGIGMIGAGTGIYMLAPPRDVKISTETRTWVNFDAHSNETIDLGAFRVGDSINLVFTPNEEAVQGYVYFANISFWRGEITNLVYVNCLSNTTSNSSGTWEGNFTIPATDYYRMVIEAWIWDTFTNQTVNRNFSLFYRVIRTEEHNLNVKIGTPLIVSGAIFLVVGIVGYITGKERKSREDALLEIYKKM